jgi:copper(I)-binding protein
MRICKHFMWLVIPTILLFNGCQAGGSLQISDAWTPPPHNGGNGGVFFTANNPTNEDDTLLSASSDIADAVELHLSIMEEGVMKMEKQDKVVFPAGEETIFQPGGLHVMLIGLHQYLNVGDSFTVTLVMEKAGEISLNVVVKEP